MTAMNSWTPAYQGAPGGGSLAEVLVRSRFLPDGRPRRTALVRVEARGEPEDLRVPLPLAPRPLLRRQRPVQRPVRRATAGVRRKGRRHRPERERSGPVGADRE